MSVVRVIPKALPGRDPRNHNHVSAALGIIQELVGFHMLESSIAELKRFNLPVPPKVKSHKGVLDGNVAMGPAFLLEVGLYFADCVLCPCSHCQITIQLRPTLGHAAVTRLCIFCAADQVLTEHWAEKAKPGKKKSRKPV
jgi:hypothetical protein